MTAPGDRPIVGIDARPLARQPTGVGRYVLNLARALGRLDEVELRLYLPSDAPLPEVENALSVILGMPSGPLRRLDNAFTWTHARLPLHLARRRVDLLHGTFYTLPAVCPAPAVVTIHDITFDLHPEWFTRRARAAFGFAASSARKARRVLTVSDRSRRDIIERYGIPEERVVAIPLAADPAFVPVRDAGRIAEVRRRYATGESYVLHVGAVTPRRNIPRLLSAFARARTRDPRLTLVLAGPVEPPSHPLAPEVERLGLTGAVRMPGYVAPEDLPALYSGALAVAYPSLYEGFGLPVLEAMACGVPVLASAGSCFPEVAGDAALLVDPLDTEALAEGIGKLTREAPDRIRYAEAGLARAALFSWERTARATAQVYREALGLVESSPASRGERGGPGCVETRRSRTLWSMTSGGETVAAALAQSLVSVIVVSWNSRSFLPGCLSSVLAQTHREVELIVVDNGSTDGSAALVKELYPMAILIENRVNTGFCAANNAGLKRARGAYILFLNADATLTPRYLEEALQAFSADRRTGMVAGKVLRFDHRTLDTTGQILTRSRRVRERGYGEPDRGQYDRPGEVFSVCGAVSLASREMIDSVSVDGQFFDEDFFAFGEDLDAGWRARNLGWRCAYHPAAVAFHYRGGTQTGRRDGASRRREMALRPPHIQAHIIKNRYLAMIKNDSAAAVLLNLPFILAWDLVQWAWLTLFSPRTLPILWRHRRLLARAVAKRRVLASRAA